MRAAKPSQCVSRPNCSVERVFHHRDASYDPFALQHPSHTYPHLLCKRRQVNVYLLGAIRLLGHRKPFRTMRMIQYTLRRRSIGARRKKCGGNAAEEKEKPLRQRKRQRNAIRIGYTETTVYLTAREKYLLRPPALNGETLSIREEQRDDQPIQVYTSN